MKTFEQELREYVEREADLRSKRQCTTGDRHLDASISRYLKIGYEDGAELLIPMLVEMYDALKDTCKHEPDGIGGYVADEFTDESVINGRRLIESIQNKIRKNENESAEEKIKNHCEF